MISRILIAASAAIVLVLGFLHLAFTFFTRKLNPRDKELKKLMRQASPRLTRQITMWKELLAPALLPQERLTWVCRGCCAEFMLTASLQRFHGIQSKACVILSASHGWR